MKINKNILLQLCNAAITAGNRVLEFYELDTEMHGIQEKIGKNIG